MVRGYLVTDRKEEKSRSRLKGMEEAEKVPVQRKAYLAFLHTGQALLPNLLIQEVYQRHAVHMVGVCKDRT